MEVGGEELGGTEARAPGDVPVDNDETGAIIDRDKVGKDKPSERDELVAAMRAAHDAEAKEDADGVKAAQAAAAEREKKAKAAKAKAAEAPAKTEEPAGEDADDTNAIRKVLKRREEENEQRQAAKRVKAEADAAMAAATAARAEAEQALAEARAFKKRMLEDPASAIREAGWDPDELVLSLARGKSPEAAAARKAMTVEQKLAEMEQKLAEKDQRETEARTKAQAEAAAREEARAKQGFLTKALDAEKFPALTAVYGKRPHLLIAEAERVGNEYHAKTGEYATWDELADYLESEHADFKLPAQPSGERASTAQAEQVTGSRTITTELAGERRSVPLDWDQMTPAQRREAQLADYRRATSGT